MNRPVFPAHQVADRQVADFGAIERQSHRSPQAVGGNPAVAISPMESQSLKGGVGFAEGDFLFLNLMDVEL